MKNILLVLIAVFGVAAGVWFANDLMVPKEPQYARLYPQARALTDVNLTDQNGEVIDTDWFKNKWTLTFVGYTFCPDICPTTLGELKGIYPKLKALQSEHPIEVLFLSVDPKRDTVPRIKEYIDFFHPEFHAATAEHKYLFPVVRAMGMMYSISDSTENNDYLVDHSASVVVIDPNGNVMGRFTPPTPNLNEPPTGRLMVSDGAQILADMPVLISQFKS